MYEKFKQLLDTHHVTSYKVSKDTGILQSTLSQWKSKGSTPRIKSLKIIADYFGVSIDYFVS